MSFKSSPKIPKQLSSPPPPPEHVARSEALRVIEDTMTSLAAGSKSQLIGTHMKRYYDMIRHESDASKLKHEHIFNSILLAMEMGRSRMIDRLLRCAQKLIDLGILRLDHDLEFAPVPSIMSPVATRGGAFSTPQSSNTIPSAFNLDILIDYLCNSRKLSSESTQIALLRFLHSAVASTHNQIHDYPLIKILQTCFTLAHANSKYPLVQAAAKDNLERIVYLVQYRLENHLARSNQPEGENLEIPPAPSSPSEDVPLDEMSIAATDEGDRAHLIQAMRENAQVEKMCREIVNQMVESLFKPMDDTMSTFSDETTSTTTTARLPDFQFQNKDDFMLSEDAEVKSMAAPMRDAFNMFLSFSRVLQKSRSESAAEVVAFADRCQMFCLESMYQYIAQLDDDSLGSPFIQKLAKNHLFPALSSTSGSTNEGIFRFSTQIMTSLFHKARSSFKFELAAFLLHHHIRILESANAPDKHRILVLESLKRLSSEPEFPVELYMNYDCEIDQPNVFHTLVEALDKVIRQVGPKVEDPDIHSDVTFRAMEILTLLLDGLSKWMKKGKPIPDQSSEGQIESLALEETEPTPKDFEAKKKQKDVFAKCVEEFNRKPKKGIASFVANEFLQDSPEQIAHFLRHTSALDKVALGEYLGEGEEHNISILEHFTASFDFRNLTFDAALRYYLTTFRLPGEAQKISRVLEFFSERFCLDNPNLFSSKDTAYVLAYSVIMLNTDAHNPMVKKKMSLEEFVRNNRGIDNGKDLPHALLEQLYRSIVSNGIKMKEMEELKGLTGLSAARKRLVVYEWESERSSQKILEMITGRHADPHSSFHPAVYADFTRLIFSSIWHVVIGALNHRLMRPLAMEDPRLPSYIASVMDAFKYSIRICVACSLTTERTVFLNAYINFFPVNEAKGNRRGESSDRANAPAHPSEAIRTILVDDVVVDEKFMKAYFPTAKAGKAEYSRLQENLEKMALIQKSFIGRRKIKVFDPMRRFIREGPVKFLSNGKLKDRYIFLFDDCLICASPVPTDSDRLYFMHSLLFLSQCKLTEEMIENNPMLQISHPEKTFIFCCDSAPQQKIWMTDLEKAIGVSADFLKASETTVQSAFQSLVSAVTCLNFECEKPNRKSSEMERRVMQIDYGQQKLHNILRGTIRKSFAFVDIISCERDPLTETVVSIVLRNSVMYEIHADTREERDEMAEAIQDLISYNSKAVPAKFQLGECLKRGFVEKAAGKSWSRVWVLLYRGKLLVYKSQQEIHPLHVIPVSKAHVSCRKLGEVHIEVVVLRQPHTLRFKTKTERDGWFHAISDASMESPDITRNPSSICASESACYPVFKLNKRGVLQMRVFQIDFANKFLNNLSDGDSHKQWSFDQISEFKYKENEKNIQIFFREFHHYEIIVPHLGDFRDLRSLLQLIISTAHPTLPMELSPGALVRKGYAEVQFSGRAMSSSFMYLYEKKALIFNNDYELHPLTVVQMRDVRNITKNGSYGLDLAHQSSLSIRCETEADRDNWYAHFVSAIRKIATLGS